MQAPAERLAAIAQAARLRLQARLRSALLVALLLAALVWFTKWPSLRAGLIVLLVAQCAVAAALFMRMRQLTAQSQASKKNSSTVLAPGVWFESQARFLKSLALFESLARALGFLVLGWGFWSATRNLAIALALGVAYPLLAYFGMERRNQSRALQNLQAEKDAFALHTSGDEGQDE